MGLRLVLDASEAEGPFDGVIRPCVFCDVCGLQIETASEGSYEWAGEDLDGPSGAEMFFTHKRCSFKFQASVEHQNKWPMWTPLEALPFYLLKNLDLDITRSKKVAFTFSMVSTEGVGPRLPREEWIDVRKAVFRRDNWTCHYCGRSRGTVALECDHVIPVSAGGSNDIDNLVTACKPCNRSKHAKDVRGWLDGEANGWT